ncbi:MAG: hypothetical protein P4L82_18625 [Ancalomicrobiaceae bacterium]|nr:hypothetical protein [Ancalomicrobiaceae bacterium]
MTKSSYRSSGKLGPSLRAKRSNPGQIAKLFCGLLDCFASLAMTDFESDVPASQKTGAKQQPAGWHR